MAKGPAVVVVARHGARLDAADKTWHLSSPTPYDPPLTYGGWTQGKALGLRIAALLHQRDNEQHEPEEDAALDPSQLDLNKLDISRSDSLKGRSARRPKKKKRKIIIHTSPFLRCVQTSTAVAAGITQFNPPGTPHVRIPTPGRERHSLLGGSTTAKSSRARSPMVEPLLDPRIHSHPKPRKDKILLRVDAFLGEWLSPDYFEDITPPPDSTLMVAAAKAGLLRRGDQIQEQNAKSSKGHFPGGWMRKTTSTAGQQSTPDASSTSGGSLAQASPFNRERSSSQGSELSLQRTRSKESLASLPPSPGPSVGRKYEPPVPSYSISPSDSIPRGYVAHAQDACLQIDYQWDSMRPPQDWGDGGLYGDEWSTMHKRFRRGLAGMMDWYREHGTEPPPEKTPGFMFKVLSNKPSPPVSTRRAADPFSGYGNGIDADDDEELVLILITHGAGCNALLGAISNQPVLMDIGLASLSMAVRRTVPRKASVPTIHERRLSVADAGMSETYEMKMLASVDHLRPGTDPTKLTASQSQVGSPLIQASPSLDSRRRLTGSSATGSPIDSPFSIGEPHRTWSSSLGNVRRTNSSGSTARYRPINRSGSATPSSIGGGLWSGTRTPAAEASASPSIVAALKSAQSEEKVATMEKDPSVTATPDIPPINGSEDVSEDLTRLDSKEERETGDKVPPLVSTQGRQGSASSMTGLWGAKPQPKPTHGLWGPPKLDDVYEHGRGPKRRWTVTEHEAAM